MTAGFTLPIRRRFLSGCPIGQAKADLPMQAQVDRYALGPTYPAAWLVKQKLIRASARADGEVSLIGNALVRNRTLVDQHPAPLATANMGTNRAFQFHKNATHYPDAFSSYHFHWRGNIRHRSSRRSADDPPSTPRSKRSIRGHDAVQALLLDRSVL